MSLQQSLDAVPVAGILVTFVIVGALFAEGGYRLGRRWQERTLDEKEGPTGMIVGSLLALLGFLLAITMGMASDRFDARRSLVLTEANSIGTTYLRAGYLAEPAASDVRGLLREYLPLRIAPTNAPVSPEALSRAAEIHAKIWSIAEDLARKSPDSVVLAIFIESLNQMIDLHETRITAGVYSRVPVTVIILLITGTIVTLVMVGYNAGLTRRRSPVTAAALIIVVGAVITLVIDIDRPRDGFLTVSQQPLIDLQQQIGATGKP